MGELLVSQQLHSALRFTDSLETVTADLEHFVPKYMQQEEIPGVCIALIRNGKVAWTRGFGVENVLTRRPMTPQTIVEVASNSKVVTAYLSLRLADEGLLSLDQPLNSFLPEPWLPPSEYRDAITLRHVLSHSAGFDHNTTGRHSLFAPGRRYSYSAVGYQYVQAVVEQVTGRSLEESAREKVFVPLGMSSSSFVNRPDLAARTANGHLHGLVPVSLFVVSYIASLIVIGLPGLVAIRVSKKRWRPSRRMIAVVLVAASVISLVLPFVLFGLVGLWEFAWLVAFCGILLITIFALLFLVGRIVIVRYLSHRSGGQAALMTLWGLLVISGLVIFASTLRTVPVPRWPEVRAEAAASMRATAGDMATFLIELSRPRLLSPEMARELRSSQVALSNDLSWGLGPGIVRGNNGNALWQWGQHIDFQSIMIIYPDRGFGVVVLANSDFLSPDVALDIAQRALGIDVDSLRRAVHLEFNFRGDD